MWNSRKVNTLLALGALFLLAGKSFAQDLEPRLLSVAPVKLKFAVLAYGYSNGNILLDPALPVEGVIARIHSFVPGYAQTFGLFGHLAKFDVILPYSSGVWRGNVGGRDTSTQRTGFGDPLFRLGINLIGSPAMSFQEFLNHKEKFQLWLSLRVRPPFGEYNPEKFFNLGTNRWSFQTMLGSSYRLNRFITELHLSAWFFTPNPSFFPDNKIRQTPLFTFHIHAAYVIKPGLWVSASFGQNAGGSTYLNDILQNNVQRNNRIGLTLNVPFGKRHALRLAYTSGITTRYGADFDSLLLIYQMRIWPGSGKRKG